MYLSLKKSIADRITRKDMTPFAPHENFRDSRGLSTFQKPPN